MTKHDYILEGAVENDQVVLPGVRGLALSRRVLRNDPRAAERALVSLSVRRATTPTQRQHLLGRTGVAAVVLVPTAAWVGPVARILCACATWHQVLEGLAPLKIRIGEDPDRVLTNTLSAGGRVLGIAPNLAWLPRSLVAAADISITIPTPNARVLAAAIAAIVEDKPAYNVGEPPSAAGLDLTDIVGAIRRGSNSAECHQRLRSAHIARLSPDPDVAGAPSLDDLHGFGEAKTWANDLIIDLAAWRAGKASFPTGNARIVLGGPPGTGKTTLIRSVAKAGNLPLVATSVASWFANSPGYLDSVIKAIDAVFDRAKSLGNALILLDEIDAVPNRATMSDRHREWWTPVVTHLLLKLDSATSSGANGLVIVGATNHSAHLDSALTRPGRLERIINVRPPETAAVREAIIRAHLQGALAEADLATVGYATAGATGADLMALVRDARRRARVAGRDLSLADLVAVAMPPVTRSEIEDRRYAVHESGHAIMALRQGFEIEVVTLQVTASTGGGVLVAPNKATILTRKDFDCRVRILLAGMAAEELILGTRSTGSGGFEDSDLERATSLLRSLHTVHGMGSRLYYGVSPAEATAAGVISEVERDLQVLYSEAKSMLSESRDDLNRLSNSLMAARVLSGGQVLALLRQDIHRIPGNEGLTEKLKPKSTLNEVEHPLLCMPIQG